MNKKLFESIYKYSEDFNFTEELDSKNFEKIKEKAVRYLSDFKLQKLAYYLELGNMYGNSLSSHQIIKILMQDRNSFKDNREIIATIWDITNEEEKTDIVNDCKSLFEDDAELTRDTLDEIQNY